jgi:hypothetical protein
LLALLRAHPILHVSRIRVKGLKGLFAVKEQLTGPGPFFSLTGTVRYLLISLNSRTKINRFSLDDLVKINIFALAGISTPNAQTSGL